MQLIKFSKDKQEFVADRAGIMRVAHRSVKWGRRSYSNRLGKALKNTWKEAKAIADYKNTKLLEYSNKVDEFVFNLYKKASTTSEFSKIPLSTEVLCLRLQKIICELDSSIDDMLIVRCWLLDYDMTVSELILKWETLFDKAREEADKLRTSKIKRDFKKLISLIHPDKHNGCSMSNSLTQELIANKHNISRYLVDRINSYINSKQQAA